MKKLSLKFRKKKVIIFDLDGTLAESKSSIDREMAGLLTRLLSEKIVAVISGGRLEQFKKQIIGQFRAPASLLKNMFLFPTTSMSFYRYRDRKWNEVYAHNLTKAEKKRISAAFHKAFEETNYEHPKKVYGPVIEDRGTQITFSALGQDIVDRLGKEGIRRKEAWDRLNLRPGLMKVMKPLLRGFEVRSGGLTSIDVTRKGIDKAYGVRQIRNHLKVPIKNMLFVGDRIFPGGNDYEAVKTGIDHVQVTGPRETKQLIKFLIQK